MEGVGAAFASFGNYVNDTASGCNVLWNNTADYVDWPQRAAIRDIHADPEFCDPDLLDFTVRNSSPAATGNGVCGPIGVHGVGCGAVSVESSTWGRIKAAFR